MYFSTINSSPGPQKSESAWKLFHITFTYVDYECFDIHDYDDDTDHATDDDTDDGGRGNRRPLLGGAGFIS